MGLHPWSWQPSHLSDSVLVQPDLPEWLAALSWQEKLLKGLLLALVGLRFC